MNGSQFKTRCRLASVSFSVLILLVSTVSTLGSAANSAYRATTPQSSYQSGLVTTPNPIDQAGNLAITGNVLGGKHFRGSIPYHSTSSFSAPLGSTSLDSFLRYSTVPEDLAGYYPKSYSPFYSPTRTVTTTSPGYQGIFTAASPKIAGGLTQAPGDRAIDTMSATEVPRFYVSTSDPAAQSDSVAGPSSRLPYWPVPAGFGEAGDRSFDETAGLSTVRPSGSSDDPLVTSEEYQRRLQLLLRDLDRARANASQIEQELNPDGTKGLQQRLPEPRGQLPLPETVQDGIRVPGDEPGKNIEGVGSESTGLKLYDPSVRPEDNPFSAADLAGEIRPSVMPPRADAPAGSSSLAATLQRVSEYASRLQAASGSDGAAPSPAQPDQGPVQTASPQHPPDEGPPQTYENSGSITQQQFDQYMVAADLNMRRGRYARAVESFALASVYIPHDPRPYLGKSHALLAVGDYVNSALSLARAIELDAESALRRVDLIEIVGGPDSFVTRIGHLEELAERDAAGALQFLVAYVYYQMDRPNEAKNAVEAARRGVMSTIAVGRLAAVIAR